MRSRIFPANPLLHRTLYQRVLDEVVALLHSSRLTGPPRKQFDQEVLDGVVDVLESMMDLSEPVVLENRLQPPVKEGRA